MEGEPIGRSSQEISVKLGERIEDCLCIHLSIWPQSLVKSPSGPARRWTTGQNQAPEDESRTGGKEVNWLAVSVCCVHLGALGKPDSCWSASW